VWRVVQLLVVIVSMASRLAEFPSFEGRGHLDGVSVRIVYHLAPA
tara:strand:- start:93 stop:227 length:135 start_codon:yes stop_codon:yes gene_type:complete